MNWRAIAKFLGFFSWVIAGLIALSSVISLLYHEKEFLRILFSAGIPLLGGLVLMQFSWKEDIRELSHREATLLIALTWLMAILWGALPFYLAHLFGSYSFEAFLNSFFESTAGVTATAASVLIPVTPLENLPHGLLFWRSLSQWLGGLSIIQIALLFLPFIRSGGMELFQTGSIARERLRTKLGDTALTVALIYLGFTLLAVVSLKLAGMNLFDALCHAFSTVSSGGFSTHTDNVDAFHGPWIQILLMVFMILGTTNFALHVSFFRGEWKSYWLSSELRLYFSILLSAALLIAWNLHRAGMQTSFQEVLFNVVSIGSTTGFWSANVSLWPSFAKGVLLLLLFVGGTVASTSGGIKCFRIILLMKYAYRQVFRIIHPASFTPVKLEGRVVERETLDGVAAFFFIYLFIFAVASLIMQSLGYNILVSASAAASTLGGVGPGFSELGAFGGYYSVPVAGKITLIACMILGRVEILPIMVVLSREFWRK